MIQNSNGIFRGFRSVSRHGVRIPHADDGKFSLSICSSSWAIWDTRAFSRDKNRGKRQADHTNRSKMLKHCQSLPFCVPLFSLGTRGTRGTRNGSMGKGSRKRLGRCTTVAMHSLCSVLRNHCPSCPSQNLLEIHLAFFRPLASYPCNMPQLIDSAGVLPARGQVLAWAGLRRRPAHP